MKEPDWKNCTEEELWKYVASHLESRGLSTVLVGGAVVSIYSEGAYRSGDLDFVLLNYKFDKLPEVLKEIGFERKDSRYFKHPKCKHLFIEFQNPPVAIGDDTKIVPNAIKLKGITIKIFSPTDCIRDRLASYIYFNAPEGLDQAVLVALRHPFNLKKVEKWCKDEGFLDVFLKFKKILKSGLEK